MKTYVCTACKERTCVVVKEDKCPVVPVLCPFSGAECEWHEVKEHGEK